MQCPVCQVEMAEGKLACKQSFFTLNLYPGFDKRNWFFKSSDGSSEKIMSSWRDKAAFRCRDCGLIALPPT